jgi:nucleoprotein TPR
LENPTLPSDEYLSANPPKPAENIEGVITDNLVLFSSIGELQEQNQKLLKITRELGAKMEAEESEYREALDREQGEAVKEAHEAIQELAAQLERQRKSSETTIQAYMKERDTLKSLLARAEKSMVVGEKDAEKERHTGENGEIELAKELAETQNQFTVFKTEMGLDSVRLREDLLDSQREIGKLNAALAKANAKVEYLNGGSWLV